MTTLPHLRRLAERVGAALDGSPGNLARDVEAALREATAETGWLPEERRRASHEHYARHLLHADPAGRFSILSLVWDPGQKSPIHGHQCWCGVAIYQGELMESLYREGAGGKPALIESVRRRAGLPSFDAAAAGIHRLANESGATAVSLHVYGIAGDRVSNGVNRIYS